MTYIAGVTRDSISILNTDSHRTAMRVEIGLDILGNFEGVTDALSDRGWEQVTPWTKNKMYERPGTLPDMWNCEVVLIEGHDNKRRADLAVRLSEEDAREGLSREIRPRVDAAIDFERDMRDRMEYP